jgi:hypothetical protein
MTKTASKPPARDGLVNRQHSDTTRLALFLATALPYFRTVTKTARVVLESVGR